MTAETSGSHDPVGCSRTSTLAVHPLGERRTSSTVALAEIDGKVIAFVANEDSQSIHTLDVDTKAEIAVTPLHAIPSQMLFMPDGRLAVLLRNQSKIALYEPAASIKASLAPLCTAPTATEPVALAMTPDDTTLLVTSGWGRTLGAYTTDKLQPRYEVKLGREPRGIVVSDDGTTAFIAHSVGSQMSMVDLSKAEHDVRALKLKSKQPLFPAVSFVSPFQRFDEPDDSEERRAGERVTCQSYALAKSVDPPGRILMPQVMVDPGDSERRPGGYGDENTTTELPSIAVIDEGTKKPLRSSVEVVQDFVWLNNARDKAQNVECLLPRAATVDTTTRSLLVTCYGIDAVIAYDAAAANPARVEKQRWSVGAGPSGIAIDNERRRAVVWSQFEHTLSVISLGGIDPLSPDPEASRPVATIALAPETADLPANIALGRQLFHAVGDSRISLDGRACASCHPDGRDDGLVWATPDGPRRTLMLAGRLQGTEPFAWSGSGRDLNQHLEHTFERLNGQGLRSIELKALAAYISTLAPPPAIAHENLDKVAKGKQIFHSKAANCSSCHLGTNLSDQQKHNVQSATNADRSTTFDTPSLRFLSGRAPYFHDGRFQTLRELLVKTDGSMGHTQHLTQEELGALEAYLMSL